MADVRFPIKFADGSSGTILVVNGAIPGKLSDGTPVQIKVNVP